MKNILLPTDFSKNAWNAIGYAHSFYKVTIKSTVASAIRDFSEAQNADLIVLTNYSHTFLEKITQEPVVRKMMFKSSKSIMVLPDLEG